MSGKLLAFIDIFVESTEMDNVIDELSKVDGLEELYEVTGEFDIVVMISAADIETLRDVLKNRITKIKGIKSTVSSIVLKAYKGPKCQEKPPITAASDVNAHLQAVT